MNTGVWLTFSIGFLVIVIGLIDAIKKDRKINSRRSQTQKRIVIFEKIKQQKCTAIKNITI
jgi:heme exporter protein D